MKKSNLKNKLRVFTLIGAITCSTVITTYAATTWLGKSTRVLDKSVSAAEYDAWTNKETTKNGDVRLYASGGYNVMFQMECITSGGSSIKGTPLTKKATNANDYDSYSLNMPASANIGTNNSRVKIYKSSSSMTSVQVVYNHRTN